MPNKVIMLSCSFLVNVYEPASGGQGKRDKDLIQFHNFALSLVLMDTFVHKLCTAGYTGKAVQGGGADISSLLFFNNSVVSLGG